MGRAGRARFLGTWPPGGGGEITDGGNPSDTGFPLDNFSRAKRTFFTAK